MLEHSSVHADLNRSSPAPKAGGLPNFPIDRNSPNSKLKREMGAGVVLEPTRTPGYEPGD